MSSSISGSGNTLAGTSSSSETTSVTATTISQGFDARGDFSATETNDTTTIRSSSNNAYTGEWSSTSSSDTTSTLNKSGDDGTSEYSRVQTSTTTVNATQSGNAYSGEYMGVSTLNGTSNLAESGSHLNVLYSLNHTGSYTASTTETGNAYTGAYTRTTTSSFSSSLDQTGSDGTGSYVLDKTESALATVEETGNAHTGDYNRTVSNWETSTADETTTTANGTASFVEILTETTEGVWAGNYFTGMYSGSGDIVHTRSVGDDGSNDQGNFSLTEYATRITDWEESGNAVTGVYERSESTFEEYELQQSGDHNDLQFDLTLTGTATYTVVETGNTVDSTYHRTKAGTDSYHFVVLGSRAAGTFSQTLVGTEDFTVVETGNLVTESFSRTLSGGGNYTLTVSGSGSTQSSGSGSTSYSGTGTGNPVAGYFSLALSGTTRYDLLEGFNEVSNARLGSTPGHLEFHPFGTPFTDPPPADESPSNWNRPARQRGDQWYHWVNLQILLKGEARLVGWGLYSASDALEANGYSTLAGVFEVGGNLTALPEGIADNINPLPVAAHARLYGETLPGIWNHGSTAYSVSRAGGHGTAGSVSNAVLLPVADATGVTLLESAYEGRELISNRKLPDSERWSNGMIGGVQVILTAEGGRQLGNWGYDSLRTQNKPSTSVLVAESDTGRPRARHHTDLESMKGSKRDGAINPARADPPVDTGVHVETQPFGPTKPGLGGPKAQTGAAREGAYIEIDLPSNAVPTNVGPRNTAVIPASEPLPIGGLNPTFVSVRRWWNLWYFWR